MEWRQNVRVVAFAAASFCMLCFVYIFLENMSAILLLSFLDFFRSPCIRQQASTVGQTIGLFHAQTHRHRVLFGPCVAL